MKPSVTRVKSYVRVHQFATAIALVIFITGVLTSISMYLYIQSGASGLDLSRPGYSAALENPPQQAPPEFSDTGPLTAEDLQRFRELFLKQRNYLKSLNAFDDDALSDEALGFTIDQNSAAEESF